MAARKRSRWTNIIGLQRAREENPGQRVVRAKDCSIVPAGPRGKPRNLIKIIDGAAHPEQVVDVLSDRRYAQTERRGGDRRVSQQGQWTGFSKEKPQVEKDGFFHIPGDKRPIFKIRPSGDGWKLHLTEEQLNMTGAH